MDGAAMPQSLFGLQTWIALPRDQEDSAAAFVHAPRADLPLPEGEGKRVMRPLSDRKRGAAAV